MKKRLLHYCIYCKFSSTPANNIMNKLFQTFNCCAKVSHQGSHPSTNKKNIGQNSEPVDDFLKPGVGYLLIDSIN